MKPTCDVGRLPHWLPCLLLSCLLVIAHAAHGAEAAATAWVMRDDAQRAVSVPQRPRRVVSLLPSVTETVCELGGCDRLVGVDHHSNWPPEVLKLPKLGGLYDPALEAIARLKPDLILAPSSLKSMERLLKLGIPVALFEPKTMEDFRRLSEQLAPIFSPQGPELARTMWQRIEQGFNQAQAQLAVRTPTTTTVYVEVAPGPYAASAGSYVGEILSRLGLSNIVPAHLGVFPKLNPEWVLRHDPDWIVIAANEASALQQRPGWQRLKALQGRQICRLSPADQDLFSRPGPRVGQAASVLARCLRRSA